MANRRVAREALAGALAGAAATWVMGKATSWLYAAEDAAVRERERAGWVGGEPSFVAGPALGLGKGPRAFPWQAHARGLAGRPACGVSAERALELLCRVA